MSVTAAEEPDLEQTRPNYKLAEMLIEIGEYERYYNNQIYKFNAYMNAAEVVENFPKKITNAEQMQRLPVGRGIGKLIREYIATGKMSMLEMIRETKQDEVECIKELTRVPGIGPLVAKSLISQGVKTIEQLKKNQDLLYHNQIIGLKYLNDLEKRIHREEIESIDKYIENQVASLDKRYHVTLCGSYRRGAEFSDSIDILLTHPIYVSSPKALENHELKNRSSYIFQDQKKKSTRSVLHKVIQKLVHEHFIVDTLTEGERRYTGVCKLKGRKTHRKLVVNLVPFDQYWCGVLYLTGNDLFNKYLRKIAKENGFVLSQYGLRRVTPNGRIGKAVRINSEEDIFKHLGLDYVKPELREFKV